MGPLLPSFLFVSILAAAMGVPLGLEADGPVTYALFDDGTVDLKLNGKDGVQATIGGAMAPGDEVTGALNITGEFTGSLGTVAYDLDIDLQYSGNGPPFTDLLHFSKMTYGNDDLLTLPDRNLIAEIDANPATGNGDGNLSLEEFQAGVNDLPQPGPPGNPTLYDLGVRLQTTAGNQVQGAMTNVTFIFYLAPITEADLN